jgi:imidazolonepropionase-like amidohydrolase
LPVVVAAGTIEGKPEGADPRSRRRAGFGSLLVLVPLAAFAADAPESERNGELVFATDPAPSTYSPGPRYDTLIRGAIVLDGAGGKQRADVLLRDGRIADYAPQVAPPPGTIVVEAEGRWVTPGLIDLHTHDGSYAVPQTVDHGPDDVTETSSANVAETWIEHGVRPVALTFGRALAGGVTTLQILPGSQQIFNGRSVVVKPVRAVTVQQMKFPGAAGGLKLSCGENAKNSDGRFPTSRMGIVAEIREELAEARHYAFDREEERDGRRADAGSKPGPRGKPPKRDEEKEALAAMLRGEIRAHVHCYRADDIAVMLNIAREFGFRIAAVHHAAEAYKVADLLREAGTCAAVWPDWWGFKHEAEDAIPENAAFVDAAGGCAILHSDIPLLGDRLNMEAAKAAAAGRRAGLDIPPERAIRWITSNPARALGLEDRIGTIAPGMNADVVIWSGDPFSIYTRVDQVFIDGSRVYDRFDPAQDHRSDFELGRPAAEVTP